MDEQPGAHGAHLERRSTIDIFTARYTDTGAAGYIALTFTCMLWTVGYIVGFLYHSVRCGFDDARWTSRHL